MKRAWILDADEKVTLDVSIIHIQSPIELIIKEFEKPEEEINLNRIRFFSKEALNRLNDLKSLTE